MALQNFPGLSLPIPNFRVLSRKIIIKKKTVFFLSLFSSVSVSVSVLVSPSSARGVCRAEPEEDAGRDIEVLMENIGGRNHVTLQKAEAVSHHLLEGTKLLLSRWNGLQMAVQNQWGGHDSLQKSHHLATDIVSWFSQSKGPLYVEDLETLLHERMLLSFNTEIEDGSIEEVAEQLMIMYEEYLHGNN